MIPSNTYKLLLSVLNNTEITTEPANTYQIFRSIYDESNNSLRFSVNGLDERIDDSIDNKNYLTETEIIELIETIDTSDFITEDELDTILDEKFSDCVIDECDYISLYYQIGYIIYDINKRIYFKKEVLSSKYNTLYKNYMVENDNITFLNKLKEFNKNDMYNWFIRCFGDDRLIVDIVEEIKIIDEL